MVVVVTYRSRRIPDIFFEIEAIRISIHGSEEEEDINYINILVEG